MASTKKITLKSSDGETFGVDQAVALQSQTIKHVIEDVCTDNGIPLPNVTGKILAMVIDFCELRDWDPEFRAWDKAFVEVDLAVLFDLILAANYLNIESLLELTCQRVADMIKGWSLDEICKTFNIVNDYTPEEEEELQRENQWDFDNIKNAEEEEEVRRENQWAFENQWPFKNIKNA